MAKEIKMAKGQKSEKASGLVAVYPGSFDPITRGHLDIIERAKKFFDKLIVAVAVNPRKEPFFTIKERLEMIKEVVGNDPKIEVEAFNGLLVEYIQKKGIKIVIRGLRALSDFDYEFQMALTNRKLYSDAETFFLMTSEPFIFMSSATVREIAQFGGSVECMVPPQVVKKFRSKVKELKKLDPGNFK